MTAWDTRGDQQKTMVLKGGINLTAVADKIFGRFGAELQLGRETSEHRRDIGNIDLVKHLRAVCQYKGRNHRLLIYVDEVQKIAQTAAVSEAHHNATHNNLYILNDRLRKGKKTCPSPPFLPAHLRPRNRRTIHQPFRHGL